MNKDNILVRLIKKGDKLEHKVPTVTIPMYKAFIEALEEGQEVEVLFEAFKDDGTNAQLAKIHACIRKLAQETGYQFEEMKLEIKRKAGLCWEGKAGTECKSFADCSKEELMLVIEALNVAGDMVNISFS